MLKVILLYIYNKELGIYEYNDIRDQFKIYYDHVVIDEDIDQTKAEKFAKTIHSIAANYKELFNYENRYINCLNGVIDTDSNDLLPFTPNIKLDTKFNGNYINDIEKYKEMYNNSRFKSFLENILDKESILTLQEAWGLCCVLMQQKYKNVLYIRVKVLMVNQVYLIYKLLYYLTKIKQYVV